MNEYTYNTCNEVRFPISFGIFPDISLFGKFLNNWQNIKYIFLKSINYFIQSDRMHVIFDIIRNSDTEIIVVSKKYDTKLV